MVGEKFCQFLSNDNCRSRGRVAQAFGTILAAIGTPACFPKTRGKSPGWPKEKKRTPKIYCPIVKKRYSIFSNSLSPANSSREPKKIWK